MRDRQDNDKVGKSLDFISSSYVPNGTVLLCSFGKDSMVLLHLIRRCLGNIPVAYYHLPGQNDRNEFANKVIRELNLMVYDLQASTRDIVFHHEDKFDLVSIVPISKDKYISFFHEITDDGSMQCILNFLKGPFYSATSIPWNVFFHAHKSSDIDPMFGPVPLKSEIKMNDSIKICYPLRDWTDEDIWNYAVKNNLMINELCYNKDNNFAPFLDKRYNNNYYSACTECINPVKPKFVRCRIANKEVLNIRFGDKEYYHKKFNFYNDLCKLIL